MLSDERCDLLDPVVGGEEGAESHSRVQNPVQLVDVSHSFPSRLVRRTPYRSCPAGTVISLGAIMWRMGSVVSSSMDSAIEYLSK